MQRLLLVFLLLLPVAAFAQETARYLVPLYVPDPIDGAYGSKWVTELSVVNGGAEPVVVQGILWPCTVSACPPPPPILPGVTFDARLSVYLSRSHGIYLTLPAENAHDISFHLRVRDLSREDLSWGAEIPIVQPEEARTVINLVDIPRDDRYRTTVRAYDLTAAPGAKAHMRIYRPTGAQPWPAWNDGTKDQLLMEVDVPFDTGSQSLHPGYAELTLTDNSALAGTGKLRIEVTSSSPASRIWAFASIANNTTQQVSIISPN